MTSIFWGRQLERNIGEGIQDWTVQTSQVKRNLTIQQQIQSAMMVCLCIIWLQKLSSKFKKWDIAYNLRDSVPENKLNVPLLCTSYYEISYSGAILWNSLSCDVREADSLRQFKRLLKRHVQGMVFVENSFVAELFFTITALLVVWRRKLSRVPKAV